MRKFSFIHCADLHLASPFSGIHTISENIGNVLMDATFKAFDNVIHLAIKERADFLIIAGDVYDSADRSLQAQWRFHQALRRAVDGGVQCFLAHGNHDPLSGWEAGLSIPAGVVRFGGDKVENAVFMRDNEKLASIYGISYQSREIKENLANRFPKGENDIFSIGVLHCNVGNYSDYDDYAPCTLDDLLTCGMDYWALGHIHTRNVLRESKPCIVYPGNTQGRNIRESDARGCYLVKVSETAEISAEFIPTDVVRWFVEEIDISEIETIDNLMETLYERRDDVRSRADERDVMLRIYLTGRGELHRELGEKQVSEIVKSLRENEEDRRQFVWIESIQSQTLPAIDISQRRQVEDFVGEFLKAAEALRKNPDASSEMLFLLSKLPGYSVIADQLGNLSKDDLLSILDDAEIMGIDRLLEEKD